MEYDDDVVSGFGSALPPALVSLTPSVSPSPRRLSSCFTKPNKPVRAKRQLAWVSLQGRLVGVDEASSARTIDRNGVFTAKEAVAWDMFTPMQRVMIVAIVSAAAVNSNKNREIFKLQKSVQFRDQVLLSMQEKLDNLCEQVNYFKDQPEIAAQSNNLITERGCKLCQHHNIPQNHILGNTPSKGLFGDEVFQSKTAHSDIAEPEERRMSDLSDWAPSVTSSVDIQLDSLAIEHDISSLLKECEEKDDTIRELSSFLQSSEVIGSKRIAELEDIIRRKNMIINKLRKDISVLEQKVVNLTRLRRSSFPTANSHVQHFPVMADNVLYDMDSSTGPSSSDSDSPPKNRLQALSLKSQQVSVQISEKSSKEDSKCGQVKRSTFMDQNQNQNLLTSHLKEKSLNQPPNSVSVSKPKLLMSSNGENRGRRRALAKSNEVATQKRWA